MNRIKTLFSNKISNILSVYFTAGYPELDSTVPLLEKLEKNGVDLVELGIPYSDPLADGPTIQESSTVAIRNGMKIEVLFKQLEDFRKKVSIPVVLMSYFNPINIFGFERFCQNAHRVGIDGLIIPDLPEFEYKTEYKNIVEKYGLTFNMLITNHTPLDRINEISSLTSGFLYLVSSTTTTGRTQEFNEEQMLYFKRISELNLGKPLIAGFGIHNKATFKQACTYCNGAIIGSEMIRTLKKARNIEEAVDEFTAKIL